MESITSNNNNDQKKKFSTIFFFYFPYFFQSFDSSIETHLWALGDVQVAFD